MRTDVASDVYSLREIARAAGVSEAQARAMAGADRLLTTRDAVRLGRALVAERRASTQFVEAPLFSKVSGATSFTGLAGRGVPLAVSGSLHLALLASIIFVLGFRTSAAAPARDENTAPMHLVFLAIPGPGGGGGGGGQLQKAPPPKAKSLGRNPIAIPLPHRDPPKPIEPAPAPPEPKPRLLAAEPLPAIVAPIVAAPNDDRNRSGLLEQIAAQNDSRGSGRGGGVGSGTGSGIGEGDGAGIGPGSGGGTGGGPYRPGSGITPPRVLREVKADYTEAARQRALTGEVVLEIVVRRDGSVGDVKLLHGLGLGLDDRAIAAVRQWRFAPAERLGVPVDVIVEVGVDFRLR
jgi:periplasmic protein TonB